MYRSIAVSASLSLLLTAGGAMAQEFTGRYEAVNAAGQPVALVLQQETGGRLTGSLSGTGTSFPLEGALEDEGSASGRVQTGAGLVLFEAYLTEAGVDLLLASPDANGEANYDTASEISFVREGGAAAAPAGGGAGAPDTAGGAAPPAARGEEPGAAAPPAGQAATRAQEPASAAATPAHEPAGPSEHSPLARQWDSWLRGKKVTRFDRYDDGSGGGWNNTYEVHLCSDGRFLYREDRSMNFDVQGGFGYSGGKGESGGTWRILAQGDLAGIELRHDDGRVDEYRLEHDGQAIYANGNRVTVEPGEVCP